MNLTETIIYTLNNGGEIYELNDASGSLNSDAQYYTKNSDLGNDFIAYTDDFINRISDYKESKKLWIEYIDYIPLFSKLNTNDTLKGLEFMDHVAALLALNCEVESDYRAFFDDPYAYSIYIFNVFMAVLMSKDALNKDEILKKFPNLTKRYNYFLADLEIGFPQYLPILLIQEYFK